jgi:hypothetical protein
MKKVVVERPRGQSYVPNRKFGARLPYLPDHDYDEQPKRVGISASYRDYGYSAKWFTDVLGPLRRFLEKNVGRPWNDVYSEMCTSLDKRKATGKHIFDHAMDMVETNCFLGANGKISACVGELNARLKVCMSIRKLECSAALCGRTNVS